MSHTLYCTENGLCVPWVASIYKRQPVGFLPQPAVGGGGEVEDNLPQARLDLLYDVLCASL